MRGILAGVWLVVTAFGPVAADDKADAKIDAKKLVGRWSAEHEEKKASAVMEFTKDSKLTVTVEEGGKATVLSGTYKLDGAKLVITFKAGDKEVTETLTVLSLTDDELVTKDSKGKKDTMERVADKDD